MKAIVKIENLSKMYRLGSIGTGTLTHDLKRWYYRVRKREDPYLKIGENSDGSTKSKSNYIWALKDINLEVMPGEVLGIIGKNGAGKSTLLKILSRVTGPTTGAIHYNGRIGSLLEVGTGFHPELTGRENIFLNGAILGMTKAEIRSRFDEIVDFSGVERYIDTPVKRYSSGMMVRLGFAVAAHLEPEILIVDEVLAVGDAEFQKKAIGKMQDVSQNSGRTVLFVSHNMGAVKNLCSKAVLLENGRISYNGATKEAISFYLNRKMEILNFFSKEETVDKLRLSGYTLDVYFSTIEIENDKVDYYTNDKIVILCSIKCIRKTDNIRINGTIFNNEEQSIGGWFGRDFFDMKPEEERRIKIELKGHNLVVGNYVISLSIGKGDFTDGMIDFDVIQHVIKFNIVGFDSKKIIGYSVWNSKWGNVLFNVKTTVI